MQKVVPYPLVPPGSARARSPGQEILRGFLNWEFWLTLAWVDIRGRYRRTVLGPFWSVLNSLIFVLILGTVYSQLWRVDLATFLPFLTAGYFVWSFFSSTLSESAACLHSAGEALKTMPVSPMAILMRVIARNLMVFTHNLVIFAGVALTFGMPLTLIPLAIPGMAMVALTCLGFGTTIAFLCSRFRDFEQIVQSLLQITFFVSPILWQATLLPPEKRALADLNPVFHLLRIVRDPMLGAMPPLASLEISFATMLVALAIGTFTYCQYRRRLAFWL